MTMPHPSGPLLVSCFGYLCPFCYPPVLGSACSPLYSLYSYMNFTCEVGGGVAI